MEFADANEAANALASAVQAEMHQPAPVHPVEQPTEQATAAPETQAQVDQGATPEDTSFTSIDPNTLPEELKPIYKSLQGAFTRKTQEIAELRKQYDGLDVGQARQALEFAQRLSNDPQFAYQVHERLSQSLQSQGYTPAQASQMASQQMTDEYEDDDEPAVPAHIEQQLAQLSEWQQRVEDERLQTYLANELQRQEMAIRQSNPEYTDTDFEAIYQLSYATNGDLTVAHDVYSSMQERFLSGYLSRKEAAPATTPTMGTPGIQPQKFDSVDEAHNAALEAVRAWQASL